MVFGCGLQPLRVFRCRIFSPAILSPPSRASGHLIIHVMSSASKKAVPGKPVTAFAASYITLADYQTAKSPKPPTTRATKRRKAVKGKSFNRLPFCQECRRGPDLFYKEKIVTKIPYYQ